jgi:glycosyltransferase involved in cell wall biosynthesis
LRIALDGAPLTSVATLTSAGAPAPGGVGRYAAQLLSALAREFPQDEFVVVSDQRFVLPCSTPNVSAGGRPANFLERRWWTFGVQRELRRLAADIFHGINFAVPFPPVVPAVMTILDLSPWFTAKQAPWVTQEWRARSARVRKRAPWMIRTGAARHIITLSEAIRREVIDYFRVEPNRVTAIPLAAAAHFRPRPPQPRKPYFLYAGMFEPRKNIEVILAAWSELRAHSDVDLVIAGPHRPESPAVAARPGLELRGEVSEDELAQLYSGAIALVYPSHYEGFGLPVLEAMQCGTPVIISRDPALVETAGDAAISTDAIYGAMRSLLENPGLQSEMRARSLSRAAQFTWERTARATYDVYRSLLLK